MHSLWNVPIEGCPCHLSLNERLKMAEENIINNRVDLENVEVNTFGPNGFKNPEALLYWLHENKPNEKETVCHGDFCLPNILLSDSGVSGMIDLGRSGIADPWLDIALCCRSLDHNYSGLYDGNRYKGFEQQMLFDVLEIRPVPELIRYYTLLDELF